MQLKQRYCKPLHVWERTVRMNQREYITGIKGELQTLDELDERLEGITSMCAAFESAYREGGNAPETYTSGFTLLYKLLCDFRAEYAAFSRYLTDTYLKEPIEA